MTHALTAEDLRQLVETYCNVMEVTDLCPMTQVDAKALHEHYEAAMCSLQNRSDASQSGLTHSQRLRMQEIYGMIDGSTCPMSNVSLDRLRRYWVQQTT